MEREQVAHELRTPLTMIKGVLHLLGSGRLLALPADVASELIERAERQVVALEEVIQRVEREFDIVHEEDRVIVLYEEVVQI